LNGDAARLVFREHLRLPRFVFIVARVDVNERLTVGVTDDIAAGNSVGTPGRGESGRDVIVVIFGAALVRRRRRSGIEFEYDRPGTSALLRP